MTSRPTGGGRPSEPKAPRRRRLRKRPLVLVVLAAAGGVLAFAATRSRPVPKRATIDPQAVRRIPVGRGSAGAQIVVRGRLRPRQPIVLFLHGWRLVGPNAYRGWLDHLAEQGSVVIVPRYQTRRGQDPTSILGNAVTGLRAALRTLPEPHGNLIAAGHSAGGALAADYAAIASDAGLPVPKAVFAVYPGRAIRAGQSVPAFEATRIAPATRIVVLASPSDDIVGTLPAEQLVASATSVPAEQRELIRVEAPRAADHYAPVFDRPAVRREMWARLDELVRSASGAAGR